MKTALLFSTGVACGLLALRSLAAADVAADWNAELDAIQQTSQQDAAGRARASAIMHTVLAETMNGIEADKQSGRPAEPVPAGANVEVSGAQAAYSVLSILYPQSGSALDAQLAKSLAPVDDSASAIAAGKDWGKHVAEVVLAEEQDAVALNAGSFAKEEKTPDRAPLVSAVPAEQTTDQTAIGPGRYRFTVLAGAPGTHGYVDDAGASARFDSPGGIAVDASGNVYVSEQGLCIVRKISPAGVVTTLAGSANESGSQDGVGSAARFNQPSGLAVDGAGNVLVADSGNYTIRKIDPSGNVTTVAGTPGSSGEVDGSRANARFFAPAYVAVDAAGNVFVTEDKHFFRVEHGIISPIREIAPDGTVSSLTVATAGTTDGNYRGAPRQICVDRAGHLYVIDSDQWDFSSVVELAPTGSGNYSASQIVPPDTDSYSIWATGIGVDKTGSLYVRTLGEPIYTYSSAGGWQPRYVTGGIDDVDWIEEVTTGESGELYIARIDGDRLGAIEVGVFDPEATGPVILQQPKWKTAQSGSNAEFDVQAAGGPAMTYQWFFNSSPINGANSASLVINNVRLDVLGLYSVVVTDGTGSVISRPAELSMSGGTNSGGGSTTTGTITGTSTSSSGAGSTASGGGSFDREISLAVLLLLAAAASRRHRTHRNFRCIRMLSILLPSRIVVWRSADE